MAVDLEGSAMELSLDALPDLPASLPGTGRSATMETLLEDVDTNLSKLSTLLSPDGAVRTKAAKRVHRMFHQSAQQLGKALEKALQHQAH